ncbi:MAG: hypothetical protein COZ11_09615, partial [Deltaproteobacteria bacterium CG_4_10_14_3_um_filter_51_14]
IDVFRGLKFEPNAEIGENSHFRMDTRWFYVKIPQTIYYFHLLLCRNRPWRLVCIPWRLSVAGIAWFRLPEEPKSRPIYTPDLLLFYGLLGAKESIRFTYESLRRWP